VIKLENVLRAIPRDTDVAKWLFGKYIKDTITHSQLHRETL